LGLHPSQWSKSGQCPKKLYYDCTGEVAPSRYVDAEKFLIFDMGTLIHSMLQMHFLNMYADQFKDEVWVHNEELHITGHTDGVFEFSNVRFALEMKSIKEGGNFGFEKVRAAPMEDHIRQCMIYMSALDCPFGLVLYFCKNNSQIKEHVVVWNDAIWQKLVSEALPVIEGAYNKGAVPAGKVGSHCRDCDYYNGCPDGKAYKKHVPREKDTFFRR
jgi:hypothetical protein